MIVSHLNAALLYKLTIYSGLQTMRPQHCVGSGRIGRTDAVGAKPFETNTGENFSLREHLEAWKT